MALVIHSNGLFSVCPLLLSYKRRGLCSEFCSPSDIGVNGEDDRNTSSVAKILSVLLGTVLG